jgi:hypothetical protein
LVNQQSYKPHHYSPTFYVHTQQPQTIRPEEIPQTPPSLTTVHNLGLPSRAPLTQPPPRRPYGMYQPTPTPTPTPTPNTQQTKTTSAPDERSNPTQHHLHLTSPPAGGGDSQPSDTCMTRQSLNHRRRRRGAPHSFLPAPNSVGQGGGGVRAV